MGYKLERKLKREIFNTEEILKNRCLCMVNGLHQCGNYANNDSDFCTSHNDLLERRSEEVDLINSLEDIKRHLEMVPRLDKASDGIQGIHIIIKYPLISKYIEIIENAIKVINGQRV